MSSYKVETELKVGEKTSKEKQDGEFVKMIKQLNAMRGNVHWGRVLHDSDYNKALTSIFANMYESFLPGDLITFNRIQPAWAPRFM